ncbi:MAG: hypothetical protein ACNI3A_18760 [Desulfovibrio sp.]|uniref:hypothetical protein n=1 Tax=Desulfovibrio sp. 7SRBS1 TaxID=3378064 RepID=UPI003B3FACF0
MIVVRSLVDNNLLDSSISESTLPQWVEGTSYAAGTQVQDEHREYTALLASQGEKPAENPKVWLLDGASNRWACVDYGVATASEADGKIWIDVSASWCNRLSLFDVRAATVEWKIFEKLEDGTEVEREGGSESLVYDNVTNAWEYVHAPVELHKQYSVDIPTYPSARLRVTLTRPEAKVRLGFAHVGQSQDLGTTVFQLNLEDVDYTQITGTAGLLVPGEQYTRLTASVRAPETAMSIYHDRLKALKGQVAVFELVSNNAPQYGVWRVLGVLQKHALLWTKKNNVRESVTIIGRM